MENQPYDYVKLVGFQADKKRKSTKARNYRQ